MKIELEFEPNEIQELFDNVASMVCKYESIQRLHKEKDKVYKDLEEQKQKTQQEINLHNSNIAKQKNMYEKRIEEMREDHTAEVEDLRKQIEELSEKLKNIKLKK